MKLTFKLFDFNVYNKSPGQSSSGSESDDEDYKKGAKNASDKRLFEMQMFGIDEQGKTYCVFVENFKPFFFVKVGDSWGEHEKRQFLEEMKNAVGPYYKDNIKDCKLVKRKKLYGFDDEKLHNFIYISFTTTIALNKAKYLWFEDGRLKRNGFIFKNTKTKIYESNIPPLLRYFHIQEISPSGWIELENYTKEPVKYTTCKYEIRTGFKNIIPLNEKETMVPYNICSFDIEASSSHGDFPVPVKSYKKLATNIIDITKVQLDELEDDEEMMSLLKECIYAAFSINGIEHNDIDKVYTKKKITKEIIIARIEKWFRSSPSMKATNIAEIKSIMSFMKTPEELESEETYGTTFGKGGKRGKKTKNSTIFDLLRSTEYSYDEKINELDTSLMIHFPPLAGDKVTFIGSTFLKYGKSEPYLNHCIVLDTCSKLKNVENAEIESYPTEKEVLLAWTKIIQREDPDIIIGYNIFGFDYGFMFERAKELNTVDEFLKLSRNRIDVVADNGEPEICINVNRDGSKDIEASKIVIASGEHDLRYIKMNGRMQIDLYNYFRRDFNLPSYKLDYVAGQYIGDKVKTIDINDGKTIIYSKNKKGLAVGSFVHFEESSHSTDYYKDGAKFEVTNINDDYFVIGTVENLNMNKSVRWGLAKDDVTPQDIFRLSNMGPDERAIVAKYCIQDCNLVHHLINKIDVITGFVEMASICSVPMSFLVLRGQGIKLTSFIAKKCRKKGTLMPVVEKVISGPPRPGATWDGYDGAIVLDPKCDLYLDKPVACVDYASLYPSSMISENLSHDSKVWTKTFDLKGKLLDAVGEQNDDGSFKYDNLDDYEYVNITYDTYIWDVEKAKDKIKSGTKVCRWAMRKDGRKSIMPSILEELLKARKDTKKKMKNSNDDFMKNILDKRQLSYKVTANSLYGQCGAKTSTFYEKDVAASTTATGRLLLTYAKRMIEEVYGDRLCPTKNYGVVRSRAEYTYGDTDSVFFTFNLEDKDTGEKIVGKKALEITIELAQQAGALASKFLKKPHDLEYEKTFMPFCLLSKKRYVGMLYEEDPEVCHQKSMGIVLKRRDNAPIVKDVYGGIIDILMKEKNITLAINFLKQNLQNMLDGKCSMDKLIITKSLRSNYKNPNQIAHKVLADRIGKRDPGNKPSPGDRIPFVYVQTREKKALQGDRIETPSYINENKLTPDYSFYITNQIMKPVQQLFALVLEQIPEFKSKRSKVRDFKANLDKHRKLLTPSKFEEKEEKIRNAEIKKLLFDKYLNEIDNVKNKNRNITNFFSVKK